MRKTLVNLEWFDLRKYDAVQTFDLKEWHRQLEKRQIIKRYGKEVLDTKDSFLISMNNKAQEYIDLIKKAPFVPCENVISSGLSVRHAEYFDLDMAASFNTDLKDFFKVPLLEIGGSETLIIDQAKTGYIDTALLSIDLDATDEQLEEDFSLWLSQQRAINNQGYRRQKFASKDINKWIKYRILPYLDLTLISDWEGNSLTQNKLGRMIFPNEFDIDLTERVRRSVKPIADSLLSFKAMEALYLQARAT
ncbi:MAG: DUF6387 family protein [Methylococcaceae bacterium]